MAASSSAASKADFAAPIITSSESPNAGLSDSETMAKPTYQYLESTEGIPVKASTKVRAANPVALESSTGINFVAVRSPVVGVIKSHCVLSASFSSQR